MKPIIPKEPIVPELSKEEHVFLTELAFGKETEPKKCDAIFVFSGTHKGHWEKTIEAYYKYHIEQIIVTGGRSLTGIPHPNWVGNEEQDISEAKVIISYLTQAGIPSENIVFEEKSTNSLENVLYAKEVFDFSKIKTLMVVCKSHVTGRQIRTLMKHLPPSIEYVPFTFNTVYQNIEVNRDDWIHSEIGSKRVWGEYLRIDYYSKLGHIAPIS
jgi:uncharacterized SAM-binding protein YcdF (DUF218 family)